MGIEFAGTNAGIDFPKGHNWEAAVESVPTSTIAVAKERLHPSNYLSSVVESRLVVDVCFPAPDSL